MNKPPIDIDKILPYGEMLRGFMEQSFIGKGDLKEVLRNRGVFIFNNEKQDSIPLLMCTILSPDEFDQLRESQKSKEDNPKIITQTIEWASKQTLLDSLPDNVDINSMLDLEFSNFKVIGSPNFVPVNGDTNHLVMDFKVEREDMAKSWASSTNIFQGILEISRLENDDEVKLVITHTANETKVVANQVTKKIVEYFKGKGYINSNKEIEKILFEKFSNARRIEYFMSLTKNCESSVLNFLDIVDIEFSPDKENPLPEGIDWMEEKIDDLRLNGSSLHNTLFVKEKRFHEYICLYKVDSRFKFDIQGLTGQCVVVIGFPAYAKSKDVTSELEVNVKSVSFDITPCGVSKSDIKLKILHEIESLKLKNFRLFRG